MLFFPVITCSALSDPENGNVHVTSSDFRYATTATFSCDPGYVIIGESRLVCTETGQWSAPVPTCERKFF